MCGKDDALNNVILSKRVHWKKQRKLMISRQLCSHSFLVQNQISTIKFLNELKILLPTHEHRVQSENHNQKKQLLHFPTFANELFIKLILGIFAYTLML